jgi:hypothetical protein
MQFLEPRALATGTVNAEGGASDLQHFITKIEIM